MPVTRHLSTLLGLVVAATAVGAMTFGVPPASAAQSVHVDLLETADGGMAIDLDTTRLKPGNVTFEVANKSDGIKHEFLIARTDLDPNKVPYSDARGVVEKNAFQGVKEVSDLDPGASGTLTMDLNPGTYLVFCNEPGHYKAGMYREITVTR